MVKHAAQCYGSTSKIQAGEMFMSLGQYAEAGESFASNGLIDKATEAFLKAGMIEKVLEIYEKKGDWEGILHLANQHAEYLKEEERQSIVDKYFPIALNNLYKTYMEEGVEGIIGEENKGKATEMRIQ